FIESRTKIEATHSSYFSDGTISSSNIEVNSLIEVIGVRFKKAGKIYYFDPNSLNVSLDDSVIVETARGIEFGEVVIINKEVDKEDVVLPLKKVIRIAHADDYKHIENNERKAKAAF